MRPRPRAAAQCALVLTAAGRCLISGVLAEALLWRWKMLLRSACVSALNDVARCGRSGALLHTCSGMPVTPCWGAPGVQAMAAMTAGCRSIAGAGLMGRSTAGWPAVAPSGPAALFSCGGARAARRVKQYHQRSAQYDQILKKNEQMHALVAITLALCPAAQRQLDENVFNTLRDKCAGVGLG